MVDPEPVLRATDVRRLLGLHTLAEASTPAWRRVASPTAAATLWEGALQVDGEPGGVACLLYRPVTPGPWPAVVAVHQHNGEFQLGKSEPAGLAGSPFAAYGRALAERGFLVAMPDLAGFESRSRPLGDAGEKHERLLAMNAVANGRSLHADHVRDVLAVARHLERTEDVRGRVAVVGHSLGAQIALLVLAVDAGLDVGVVSCGLTTFEACRVHDVLHNPGWYVPGLESVGGYAALARGLARNKRLLAIVAERDEHFPVAGARQVAAALPTGVADVREHPGSHAMTAETLGWLADWLAAACRAG